MQKKPFFTRLRKDVCKNWPLYVIALPVIIFYLLFSYKPMYGALMAFMDYKPAKDFLDNTWVGFKHFERFFTGPYFGRTLKNTFLLSLYNLIFGFPAPIILALMLNEVKNSKFKKITQTITYLPHFISTVIVCAMVSDFCLSTGLFNDIITFLGGEKVSLLQKPEYYRTIYIVSDIWKEIGWGSIVYLAALAGVDKELYEAARIDGAGKWKQTLHVTLPGILPTVCIMLILRIGNMMNVGYEKTLLLYNEATYTTADIISTYVYRAGLTERSYSYSTAVGLFNSVINLFLVFGANYISKKTTENSLW